jgi:hypothetical protein
VNNDTTLATPAGFPGAGIAHPLDSSIAHSPVESSASPGASSDLAEWYPVRTGKLPDLATKAKYPFARLQAPRGEDCDYFECTDNTPKMYGRLLAAIANRKKKHAGDFKLKRVNGELRVYRVK